ncbi:MAG TPA: PSD1 and planctomycete cytochrome C domain-containing protein [Pirellulales bacterium]|nr:PSD1 and planctomycete cytochrome C domain-containing protein [Pirellulales bacterium]
MPAFAYRPSEFLRRMRESSHLIYVLATTLAYLPPTLSWGQSSPAENRPDSEQNRTAIEFFEKRVRPLLVKNCYTCHSADTNAKGGLRVDDRRGLLAGGAGGPAIVPGDPEKSRLIQAVRYTDENLLMPPERALSDEEVADLTRWVADGAAWPAEDVATLVSEPDPAYARLRQEHWAWQPLQAPAAPAVRDTNWPRDDLDHFILAKLEERALAPVGDAERPALLRRLTFDLTGLPPNPDEVDAFLADRSADAWEKIVDRLLSSPAYGERWGRHWLDVARYAESTGGSRNLPFPHAWRYRDYVIDAFNADKPFDQFIREQIAGDLLPANSEAQREEQIIATGFLAVGVKDVNQRFKIRFVMDNIDEQIDAVSRSFLALTASCARCHDHKFDPIPTADYYALAGIFQSSDLCAGVRNKMGGGGLDYYDSQMLVNLGPKVEPTAEALAKIEEATRAVAVARTELQTLRTNLQGNDITADGRMKRQVARDKLNQLQNELFALTDPAANGVKTAMGVRDGQSIGDAEIRLRGEAEKIGPVVPRGFLSVVSFDGQPPVSPGQSGRRELAEWLASANNPLTSRVIVNRIWQHLFGQGLVKSVDNFGVTGDSPSHPELLDHLASRLVRDGWSIKRLVRTIVLSRAYGLAGDAAQAQLAVDPGNGLLWRHTPRRLEAEEIRDAMLSVVGTLDVHRPAASPASDLKVIELGNNGREARRLREVAGASRYRSVYLPLLRGLTPAALEVFDFAEQGMVTGHRDTTTVATQSLYLLNDPFVRREARELAARLLEPAGLGDEGRVQWAYRLAFSRPASAAEVERAKTFVTDYEVAARDLISAQPFTTAPTPAPAKTNGEADEAVVAEQPADGSSIEPLDPKIAAWTAFSQSLLGCAEFRYLK